MISPESLSGVVVAMSGKRFGIAPFIRLRMKISCFFSVSFLSTTSEHRYGDVKEDEEMRIFFITRY
jgi:hypothetical protein